MKYEYSTLDELCTNVLTGGTPLTSKSEYYNDGNIPWLKTKEVNYCRIYKTECYITEKGLLNSSAKLVPENSVIVAMYGQGDTAGRVAINKIPITTNQACCNLLINDHVADYRFVYYALKNSYKELVAMKNGGAQPNLNTTLIKSLRIPNPSLFSQCRIADILSAYDDLIENNQKQIKLLEEAAMRIYKEWFVHFRFPGHETTPIVNGVPEGWEKTEIGEVCQTIGGGTPSTKNLSFYEGGHILWVTPTDITRNNCIVILDTEKKITDAGLNGSSAKLLPPETILMTSRASVGYFGLCEREVCTNQGFISCIPNNENTRMFLLYNLINRTDEIRQKAGGATYLEISKSTFRSLDILLPNDKTLSRFQENIYPLIKEIRLLKKLIENSQQARDKLLPKLMSGEIEVEKCKEI